MDQYNKKYFLSPGESKEESFFLPSFNDFLKRPNKEDDKTDEKYYNEWVSKGEWQIGNSSNQDSSKLQDDFILFDTSKTSFKKGDLSKFEICDLLQYQEKDEKIVLHHVKKFKHLSDLSHLFNQGIIPIEVFMYI